MEQPARSLLIVDDEDAARYAATRVFQKDYRVLEADSVEAARKLLETERPVVALLDYNLPGENGMVLLQELASHPAPPAVIMITAYGSERLAVEAMKCGAYDYLSKPYDIEELRIVVSRAVERQELRQELQELREAMAGEGQFGRVIGNCQRMRDVFQTAARVAPTDLQVLLLGESGTGKDLLAQAIHSRSLRAGARFVALNCAALPENLVESELFGYQKGAFTGAVQNQVGRFEAAHRGTLFLDEIGDLGPQIQPKLLRVAESGVFERLGSTTTRTVDVRLISATNADLASRVRECKFREDLYYRLAGITIHLPPLRERGDDVLLLCEHFWNALRQKYGGEPRVLTRDALLRLRQEAWPGNVRQLRNFLEKLYVLARNEEVDGVEVDRTLADEIGGPTLNGKAPDPDDFREAKRQFEIDFLRRKLKENGGNITHTAKAIGLERQSLQEKIRTLQISANGE